MRKLLLIMAILLQGCSIYAPTHVHDNVTLERNHDQYNRYHVEHRTNYTRKYRNYDRKSFRYEPHRTIEEIFE